MIKVKYVLNKSIPFCLLLMNCFHDSMTNNPFSYISNHFNAHPGWRKEGMRLEKAIVCRNTIVK